MAKKFHPGHLEIANHTPSQQAMFFGVANALGYNPQDVKERAKKHFNKKCFNELRVSDLMWLIDKLVEKQMYANRI